MHCFPIISTGLARVVNWDIDVFGDDVQWFMQYNGFGETMVLLLYTKIENIPTWRKYMKSKHVLNIQAVGRRVLIMCKSTPRKDFKVEVSVESFPMQMLMKS